MPENLLSTSTVAVAVATLSALIQEHSTSPPPSSVKQCLLGYEKLQITTVVVLDVLSLYCAALMVWAHDPATAFASPPSLPLSCCFPHISVLPLPLQIFMRYGRQRWKLKGKIEANSRQSWDGEEMIFMPLITDLISIKVQGKALSLRQQVSLNI